MRLDRCHQPLAILAALAWSSVAVAETATGGAGEVAATPDVDVPIEKASKAKQPAETLYFQNTTVARLNPLGLISFGNLSYQVRIFDSDNKALEQNFVGLGVGYAASPAFARAGLRMEIQPLSILHLWAMAEVIGWFGSFDLLQSWPTATAEWSDTAVKDLGEIDDDAVTNYSTTGSQISFGGTLQLRLGPIAARSIFRAGRPNLNLREGDEVYYEPLFDLLVPNKGWFFNNDVDLLFITPFRLAAGVRWTFAKAFFQDRHFEAFESPDDDPNPMTHRFGPFFAYRFWGEAKGSRAFNNPTAILIVNWWLEHRYRTGEDVSQAFPYIIMGFSFDGDFLGSGPG